VPGEDALGVLGKGFIPHQVDAKMDYMNIPAAPSAGGHDRESLNSNTVHHGHYKQHPNRSSAQDNGKAPMSPDDTFDSKAAGQSSPFVRAKCPTLNEGVCLYRAVVWTIRTLQPVTAVAASEVMTILAMLKAGH